MNLLHRLRYWYLRRRYKKLKTLHNELYKDYFVFGICGVEMTGKEIRKLDMEEIRELKDKK